mmetsp:Transcript_19912/g.42911  ORF Transcript_19912/g.42911 Transcript_19912/m.42911 type:complete len:558 (+) Transcript_19912:99-1772(+)
METNDSINKQSSLVKSSDKKRPTRPQTATTGSEVVSSEPISSDAIEETELETTSSLTRPVSSSRSNNSANRSTAGRSNDKRRVVPWVEELACTPPEETHSGPQIEEAAAREATQAPEHAVGAHKVRGRSYVSLSSIEDHHSIRDMSRESSANDIVIPNAHVVEEDDAITAYVVEPPSVFFGDASNKPPMDKEAAFCSCVCPCMSCKVQNAESRKRRTTLLWIAGALTTVAVLTFIVLAATGRFRPDPPPPPLDQEQIRSLIASASPDGGASLNDTTSYQHTAFSWLVEDPWLSGFSDSQLLERYSLACLYTSLKGDDWRERDGWMAQGRSVCDWYNVTCAAWPNITSIRLIRNNLRGDVFAPEIIMMESLKVLELEGNFISSTIPEEIGIMSSLEQLLLRNNSLQGAVPSELAKLSSLQYLKLHRNDFTGTIPKELSSMDSMIYLTLGDNALSSSIPSELSQMKNLQVLKLYQNELASTIPSELGLMSSLDTLDLDRNRLVSTIPAEFGNLKHLERLRLHGNKLVGSLPTSICNLTNNIIVDCAINCTCCRKCKRRL